MISVFDLKKHTASIRTELDEAIGRVLSSGWFILGPEVDAFEREFADWVGAAHCVSVGNGTDAIVVALRALGVQPGDEVITTPNTAVATVAAIVMAGATPVLVDVCPDTQLMDVSLVARAISPRTRAVVPVHLFGQAVDLDPLLELAQAHRLFVMEDCAQAHGARYKGRRVGTLGHAASFSFYPTKNLGALGDGGAVITGDATLAARIKRLRNGGQTTRYHHAEAGANSRLDEIQAAILRARLPYLRGWTARRRAIGAAYRAGLAPRGITVPREFDAGHVYHLFPVLTPHREAVQTHLLQQGIETFIHYPVPIPRQPALASTDPRQCPVADRVCAQVLSLPIYPALSDAAIASIVQAVNTFSPPIG